MMASSPGESIIVSWEGEVGHGAEENTSVARVVSFMGWGILVFLISDGLEGIKLMGRSGRRVIL